MKMLVGYDTIAALLKGNLPTKMIIGVLVVKSIIWAVSLGSGTSGGVLAPLLMMGGALGGLAAMVLPNEDAGFWRLAEVRAAEEKAEEKVEENPEKSKEKIT